MTSIAPAAGVEAPTTRLRRLRWRTRKGPGSSTAATRRRLDKAARAAAIPIALSRRAGRRRRWPLLVAALLVVAGAAGAAAFAMVAIRPPSHPLPDVVGQPELEAATALRQLNFEVELRKEHFDDRPPGLVAVQDPRGGGEATLREGQTVVLVVSLGPPPTPVPDLAGLDEAGARQALEEVGHSLGEVTSVYSETVEAGKVVDWTLKGESPPKGASVDVVVSAGPEPREVPDLAGLSFDEAATALQELGLAAERAEAFHADDATRDKVIGITPAAGERVPRGGTVTLTVSKGQPVVPSLDGLTAPAAADALRAVGLEVGSTFGPEGGKVFLTLPGEGTKVRPGSSVTIYLL